MGTDPWIWLLGRTPASLWRHVPYQANELGQGQDPSLEPRVEVIRRLIAYPPLAFQTVVEAVQRLDGAGRPVRWLCYRDPGSSPARPYWLCFVTSGAGRRRFHFGLELFDRARLGLWFFSGYDANSVPQELLAPFPARPEVALPRVELSDATLAQRPVATWLRQAWRDELRFEQHTGKTPPILNPGESADQSLLVDSSLAGLVEQDEGEGDLLPHLTLRASRARLVVHQTGEEGAAQVELYPLARLSTLIGRDPRCNLVLGDRSISMEHCRITWRNGVPGIEELGSKNGTKLDGIPVSPDEPRPLPAEAHLTLGTVPCLFVQDRPEDDGTRHQAEVASLLKRKVISAADAESIQVEANQLGITPGEVLLRRGAVKVEDWGKPAQGGCGSAALLMVLLPLLMLLSGCHSLGLPPFYTQELDPVPMREGSRRIEWDFDVGLRPFVQVREKKQAKRSETHFLFPLGLVEKTPEQTVYRFYPVFQRYERTDPDGFPDTDTIVFPFVFSGSHPVEGSYLYLFPLGGTLKGVLGKDEAAGILFPLYGWTREKETETHHFLWPLISFTSGGKHWGFKVFPLVGHHEKRRENGELVYNRTTILWPLLHWADESRNSRNPFSSFFLFPLFGWTRSGWMDDNTILWPLFRWWHDKRSGYSEYRLPFPLFIYGSGPNHERLDFWPFFGTRQRGDYKRTFLLWPIFRHESMETEEYTDSRTWIMPLFWSHTRTYKGKDGKPDPSLGQDTSRVVFPLVRWESKRDGSEEVRIPAPLFVGDPLENFDTILAPFWRLFRYKKDSEGYKQIDILFGFWSARATPKGEVRWDLLGGLVGHTSQPDGTSKTRLLWFLEF